MEKYICVKVEYPSIYHEKNWLTLNTFWFSDTSTHLVKLFNGSINHLVTRKIILSQVATRLARLFLSSILVHQRVQWVIFKA